MTGNEVIRLLLDTPGSVQLLCHRAPDGDTLGAGLGLYLWLRQQGRDVHVYCIDAVPAAYRYLPGAEALEHTLLPAPALTVAVDTADPVLLGPEGQALVGRAPLVMNIDHHKTNLQYGHHNYVVSEAAATAEIVTDLLLDNGQTITQEMANCLYTGIVTDTGQFSFDYTRPGTLRAAAALMERGAAFEQICSHIFRRRTLSKTRLIGRALSTMRLFADNRIAVMSVSQADLKELGATVDECENVVNYLNEIDGVQVGILLREMTVGGYKCSLRGAGDANVADLARQFGGGGHVKAAGCTVPGTLAEAERQLVEAAMAGLSQ